jgi:hypothetical protein
MWLRAAGVSLVAVFLTLGAATRADEIATCEHAKLNTQDATTLDEGAWEVELSYGLLQSRHEFRNSWGRGRRPYYREEALGLGVTYGLAEDLSVGGALGYMGIYDRTAADPMVSGWTDLSLEAKWRFFEDTARRLEVAYTPSLSLPTGGAGVTDDFVVLYNGIAVSTDWTDRLTSNFDFGYAHAFGARRGDYRGTVSANAALGYHVTDWLQPEVELNYAHDFAHSSDADLLAVTLGAIICVHENVRLDVGVQQALAGRNADQATAFLAALTFAF